MGWCWTTELTKWFIKYLQTKYNYNGRIVVSPNSTSASEYSHACTRLHASGNNTVRSPLPRLQAPLFAVDIDAKPRPGLGLACTTEKNSYTNPVPHISLTKRTHCGIFIMFGSDMTHTNFFETLARRHLFTFENGNTMNCGIHTTPYMDLSRHSKQINNITFHF